MSTKQLHMYEGMNLVRDEYVAKNVRDTDFAVYATEKLERPYSVAQIRNYRETLGIKNATVKSGRRADAPAEVYVVLDTQAARNELIVGVFATQVRAEIVCAEDESLMWERHDVA